MVKWGTIHPRDLDLFKRVDDVDTAFEFLREQLTKHCLPQALGVHQLTAALSLFAEAQDFLGSEVVLREYPLRLVLDARPFI